MSGRPPRRFSPQPRAATPSRRESRLHHKKVATLLEGFDDEGFTLARRGNLERWGGAAEPGRFSPQPRVATPSRRETRLHCKGVAHLLEGFDDEGFTLARMRDLKRRGGAAEPG